MKSKKEDLSKRGYLDSEMEKKFLNLSFDQKLQLLQSNIAKERTLGARLLHDDHNFAVEELIEALSSETKLYPKIEISRTLVSYKKKSVKSLIIKLGKIGSNQYETIPLKEFKKDNYPLPRDIASRTLANIGKEALPELLKILNFGTQKQLSEAIDAIGYICFYNYQPNIFEKLQKCYFNNVNNSLIRWKIIRAMSSFPESKPFLEEQKRIDPNPRIVKEIERSLRLIDKQRNNK